MADILQDKAANSVRETLERVKDLKLKELRLRNSLELPEPIGGPTHEEIEKELDKFPAAQVKLFTKLREQAGLPPLEQQVSETKSPNPKKVLLETAVRQWAELKLNSQKLDALRSHGSLTDADRPVSADIEHNAQRGMCIVDAALEQGVNLISEGEKKEKIAKCKI